MFASCMVALQADDRAGWALGLWGSEEALQGGGAGGGGWTESSGHVARGCVAWGPCLELPTPRGRAGSGVPKEQRPAPSALRSPEGATPWPD